MDRSLRTTLREGLAQGDLNAALAQVANSEVRTSDDAAAIAELVDAQAAQLLQETATGSPLQAVLGLFQQVETHEAFVVLSERGLPSLRRLFDRLIASERHSDYVLFLVKIFVLYRDQDDLPRIAQAARLPALQDRSLWSVIFESIDDAHPRRHEIIEILRDPLPRGFAGVAFLDYANSVARQESINHPFDSPAGRELLEAWLVDPDAGHHSYAHSAAAALPFVSEPIRSRLLALGLDHPSERVQLESAWASARLGSRAGIDYLARACLDVKVSATAVAYLEELGERNVIPARAKLPEFAAAAEMCRWLAHPMEFGRPPDEVAVVDSRTLFWPPANEPRQLWLVRYRYAGARPDGSDDVGIGMVGSITFALLGETTADMVPEDAYALHCCWELEVEHDPRAPAERSVEAGRALLRQAGNGEF